MGMFTKPLVVLVAITAAVMGTAAAVGVTLGGGILHPYRKVLTADEISQADRRFDEVHARRSDFDVAASDGAKLRGWKVRAQTPNGDWVVIFHGLGDNRSGQVGYAEFLLARGYGTVLMDSRAQGESGGDIG